MFGFSCLIFGWAFSFLFYYLSYYEISGTYVNHSYYADRENNSMLYITLIRFWYISLGIGYTIFTSVFEKYFKKTKYLLTILNIIFVLGAIFLPFRNFNLLNLFRLINTYIHVSILYLYTKWSQIEFKAISSLMILGHLLLTIANGFIPQIFNFYQVIIPILLLMGISMWISPVIINPQRIVDSLKFLMFTCIAVLFVMGFFLIYHLIIFTPNIYNPVIFLANFSIFIVNCFIIYKLIKNLKIKTVQDNDKDFPNVLGMISRPQTVSEEEVTISKEKKICLVCKGKVIRFNSYICECDILYCNNCAQALSKLENACWVCNAPFDESKPINLPEKQEEQILVDESTEVK